MENATSSSASDAIGSFGVETCWKSHAINDIRIYASVGEEAFIADRMRQDAIIRQLEIIGEPLQLLRRWRAQ